MCGWSASSANMDGNQQLSRQVRTTLPTEQWCHQTYRVLGLENWGIDISWSVYSPTNANYSILNEDSIWIVNFT